LKIYSRYILHKTTTGFIGLISVLISLIWFSRAIPFVKYVTENGIGLDKFFYLFILILPWLLLFIIPISLFVAILLTYNRLITHNEITILKNSGLTKFEICKPVFLLTLSSSIVCVLISFFFMPYANKELRLSRIDFKNNYSSLSFAPQTFETLNRLTIYAKNRDESNKLSGILLHDERSDKYSITITAETGSIVAENHSALLYMQNGTVQKFDHKDQKSEILNFDDYVFNLTEANKKDEAIHWKAKERYLSELLHPEEDSETFEIERYRSEIQQRFSYPLFSLIFSAIALSCILRGGFSRHGSSYNMVLAIALAIVFLGSTMSIYTLIESSAKFTPLLYLNFILFFGISFKILNSKEK
jgi:lipopolysaccharide export system permease protein